MRVQFHMIKILIQNQAVHHQNQRHHILDQGHKKKIKTIKKLHVRYDGKDNIEQLYILPSRWLYLLKFDNFGDAIYEIFQNTSCMPMQFFVEENLVSWHSKTHGHRNYFQSLYLAAIIHKCRGKKQYPYVEIKKFYCRQKDKIISERK